MVTPPFVVAVAAVAVGDEIRLSSPSSGMRTVAWFGTPPNRSTTNVFAWSCIGGSCAWRVRSIANPVPSDSPADDLIVSGNGSRVLYLEIYGSIGDGVSISHTSDEPSSDLLRDCAEEQFACVRGVCKTDGHCACPLGFRGRTCSLAPTEAVPDHEIPVEFASELSTAFFRIEEPRGASAALYLSSPFVQVLVGVEPILSLNEAVSVGYSQVPSEVTIKTVMDGDESLQRMRLPNVNGTLFLTLMYHESLADDGTSAEAPPFPHAFTIRLDAGSDNGSGVNWTLLVVMIALAAFGAAMIGAPYENGSAEAPVVVAASLGTSTCQLLLNGSQALPRLPRPADGDVAALVATSGCTDDELTACDQCLLSLSTYFFIARTSDAAGTALGCGRSARDGSASSPPSAPPPPRRTPSRGSNIDVVPSITPYPTTSGMPIERNTFT
eukprot:CAMPEP_0170747126 /NCGR_PEP_ID=MMETSP0437-20130122/9161_1 /TAXON_ID=0 /ORGANISM="Sexangularia sp." /LENGTH=438 /DNA_ID=CAMNT_0011085893 /DNA_START=242 /DNA_END=1557 /DNA_ORIENTATION=+